MRIATCIWVIGIALLRPLTAREQQIPFWPPSAPWSAWLERVVIAPWERWDTALYVLIVSNGYHTNDGTAQFHPLLAWLATPLYWLVGNATFSLLIVASIAGLALLFLFERLARLDLAPTDAHSATLFLLFAPMGWVLFAPYTEGLFLVWTTLCLLWMRQGRWWLAGLAGGLAVLTRQQGLFLVLPLAWEIWQSQRNIHEHWTTRLRDWAALGVIPAAFGCWLMYRALALGDLHVTWNNPQALIYSLLISPSSAKVVPNQAFLFPFHTLWLALNILLQRSELSLIIDLCLGFGFLLIAIVAWKSMCGAYRIWVLTIILVSFAYYTGPFYPYMGLPRHLFLAIPVFIGLPARLSARNTIILLISGGLVSFFLLMLYVIHGWVP